MRIFSIHFKQLLTYFMVIAYLFCNASTAFAHHHYIQSATLQSKQTPPSLDEIKANDPNDLSAILKRLTDSGKPIVTDVSLEALIPELKNPKAQRALGKGGLGFLTGETWGGYSMLEKFEAMGVMPLYKEFFNTTIDWDNEEGINRVTTKDHNGNIVPFTVDVDFNQKSYEVEIFWVNRNGVPVLLIKHDEMFRHLYPEGDEQDRQYGFLARSYVELIKKMNLSPDIVRLSEGQLVFTAVAMQNDIDFYKKHGFYKNRGEESVFDKSKVVFTTHTPEMAALPKWQGQRIDRLANLIGHDLVGPVVDKSKGEWVIDAANELAKRSYIINAVSLEHEDVTKQAVLPDHHWKTVGIQNASDPDIWYSPELADKVADKGRDAITGEDLFYAGQAQKEALNKFLDKRLKVKNNFSDPSKMLISLVRRLTTYKEQGILIPMVKWITGDPDREYKVNGVMRKGLNANLLIGGPEAGGLGRYWTNVFNEMMKNDPELEGKFVFIEETGYEIMKLAVTASDVWVQAPRPTREASGTSGGRAVLNGKWVVGSATGENIEIIKHGINGIMIDVFGIDTQAHVIDGFQKDDPYFVERYRNDGAKQMADGFQLLSQYYNDYKNGKSEKWVAGMKVSFDNAHKTVAMEVMIPKYEALFEAVYDGTGAVGFKEKVRALISEPVVTNIDLLQAA